MKTQWRSNKHNYYLPEPETPHRLFYGEYYWSPAYLYYEKFYCQPYSHNNNTDEGQNVARVIKSLLLTTDHYSREDTSYDCSINHQIDVSLPSKWLIDNMDLNWMGKEGHYYNYDKILTAFDPSLNSPGPSALLINRQLFCDFLNRNNLTVFWIVFGEKIVITGDIPGEDWPGNLHILGTYRLNDMNKIIGEIQFKVNER